MSTTTLTDADLVTLLAAVGLVSPTTPETFDTPFTTLEIDSLGRTELAARLRDRFGVDVENDLHEETTPNGMRQLVITQLVTAGATGA